MIFNAFICSSCGEVCEDMRLALQVLVDPKTNRHRLFAFCSEECFTVPFWELVNRMDPGKRVQPATIVFYKFSDLSDDKRFLIKRFASWEELRMSLELKFKEMLKGTPENRADLIRWRNDPKFTQTYRLRLERWIENENSDILGGISRKMVFEKELLSKAPLGPSIYS